MLVKNKEHSARPKGDGRLCFERAERLAKQDARARIRSSSGTFACECAEQPIASRELCAAARRCGCRAGAAHGKAITHRFCVAKLLALKSIGFLMTGKKKAHRNAPVFQVLFSQHGAKRLTLKRCLLAFLWHSLLFFCRRFLFQIKRKCRNAESVKYSIVVGREDRSKSYKFTSCRCRSSDASSRRTLQCA